VSADRPATALDGELSLPRKNGELVFEAPWEGRAFGMALALTDGGPLQWNDFRRRLVAQIDTAPDHRYYEQWLAAFEALVTDAGLLTRDQLDRRAAEYRSLERDEVF
jgi:nitrile hydratase accessory protein